MAFQSYQLRDVGRKRLLHGRRRLNTNCTAESFDSGISSLDTHSHRQERKIRVELQVDDVLWCCAFILTLWYFELPLSLLTDPRLCFISFGLYLSSKNRNSTGNEWSKYHSALFLLAMIMFMFSCFMFCRATWIMWSFWTVYIVFVTFMFAVVVISFL
ncbi:unnamed protein product [Thelazia callipaeda]|uniref:Transmembrane protein n=1 Tax=Thelazia callipaeda TaxID=103827 RepID=A0A0N5CRQ0_THECL|nr:unnamed protein product [Thelazia callipaeda]